MRAAAGPRKKRVRGAIVPLPAPGLFDLLTLAGRAGQAEEQFWLEELEDRRVSPFSTPSSPFLPVAERANRVGGGWGMNLMGQGVFGKPASSNGVG